MIAARIRIMAGMINVLWPKTTTQSADSATPVNAALWPLPDFHWLSLIHIYIWQRDPKFWNRCSPLLFPIVGNCRNNKTIIEGETCCIEKHGFCRDVDFQVTRQSDTMVTFEIHDTEETKAIYPYSFRLSLTYVIENGMLSMEYCVANTCLLYTSRCV